LGENDYNVICIGYTQISGNSNKLGDSSGVTDFKELEDSTEIVTIVFKMSLVVNLLGHFILRASMESKVKFTLNTSILTSLRDIKISEIPHSHGTRIVIGEEFPLIELC